MGRLTQNEANDKLIIFKVGNDEVKLSNNIVLLRSVRTNKIWYVNPRIPKID